MQKLAYMVDIFNKLNNLNLKLQGKHTNLVTHQDSISGFRMELDHYKDKITENNYKDFQIFSKQTSQIRIKKLILEHFRLLGNRLDQYFPSQLTEPRSFISNPFNHSPSLLPEGV